MLRSWFRGVNMAMVVCAEGLVGVPRLQYSAADHASVQRFKSLLDLFFTGLKNKNCSKIDLADEKRVNRSYSA